jgi:vancomycin resistance protein VanJ
MPRVAEAISTFKSDLLGIGEYEWTRAGALRAQLDAQYPFSALYPEATDVALFSRYPITEKRLFRYPEVRSPFLRAIVDVDGTPITVYVLHLTSPNIIGLPWTYTASMRDHELRLVLDLLATESGPLLVLCDCNFTDQSNAYGALRDLLGDAFRDAGQGMGFTYPNAHRLLPLLVRIDYIWYSGHFAVDSASVLDDSGASDHRPIMAKLILKQP